MSPSYDIGCRLIEELINKQPAILNGAGLSYGMTPVSSELQRSFSNVIENLGLPTEKIDEIK